MCPACGVAPRAVDVLVVPRATTSERGRTDAVSAAMRAERRLLEPIEARAGYRAGAAPSRSAA
jgi:hypothetical protein